MIAVSIALIIWTVGLSWKDREHKKTLVVEVRHHADEKLQEA